MFRECDGYGMETECKKWPYNNCWLCDECYGEAENQRDKEKEDDIQGPWGR